MEQFFSNFSFKKFLILSIVLHVFFIALFINFKGCSFKSEKDLLIESAIQIDEVGLPDLETKKRPKQTKQKKPTKPIIKKEKKKKKPAKPVVKKEKKQSQPKSSNTSNTKEKKQAPIKKGNFKNQAGSKEGKEKISKQALSEIYKYSNQIIYQVRQNWTLPPYLTNQQYSSQVEIKISSSGELIYKNVVLSSGNKLYDSFVLKTIEQAQPYPKPQDSIKSIVKQGFVLTFPSQ